MLTGTWIDLPAIIITLLVTVILVKGIKESARFNAGIVIVKLAIVLFVIVVGAFYINPDNWTAVRPLRPDRGELLRHDAVRTDRAGR